MRGRKPVPSNLKILRGNPGKRPLNVMEPMPAAIMPPCPGHLDDVARLEWRRTGRKLLKLGVLTEIDRSALAAYCVAWSRWVEAEAQLARTGTVIKAKTGGFMQSPYLPIANKAMEQMMRLLTEFGMTPSSRSRVEGRVQEEGEADKWRGLLN